MSEQSFSWSSIVVRFLFAFSLVVATYNPEAYSYYHWGLQDIHSITAIKVFVGVVLLIGWTIFIRATFHSLGAIGLLLTFAFFGALLWVIIDLNWIPTDSVRVMSYVIMIFISWILTTGMSWSFIRRKMSGQYDVVESEEPQD